MPIDEKSDEVFEINDSKDRYFDTQCDFPHHRPVANAMAARAKPWMASMPP